jgi:phosphatidylglycerol:prolipoprotein diacylglycerol transferase
MFPVLFKIPWIGWPINSYGFLIMIGFLLATYVAVRRAKILGINQDLILDVGIISMIFGIIGAKINYVVQYPDQYGRSFEIFNLSDGGFNWLGGLLLGWLPLAFWYWRVKDQATVRLYSWQNLVLIGSTLLLALGGARALFLYQTRNTAGAYDWSLISSWQSGFVLYGGLIAGVVTGSIYTKMRGESILRIGDIAAPSMMLGLVFGRLGCLLNGCCWGMPTELPWGIRFPEVSDANRQILSQQLKNSQLENAKYHIDMNASRHLPVHPTQVYESLAALVIFLVLSWYWKRKRKNAGEVLLLLGVLYPLWRFLVEFIRDDERPPLFGSLSYSQSLSIMVFILAGAAFYFVRMRPQPAGELPAMASDAKPAEPAKPTEATKPADAPKAPDAK